VELPASESEVNEISQLFSSRNLQKVLLTRQQADEQTIKDTRLENFTYLHFATHGIVDETNPELSRIFLHSSSAGEDGSLYSGEIFNLQLNAKLVTLSACQTGLGKIFKGEGVIGLSRALAYAGSEKVMVSFWNVPDQSTADLMKNFYHELLSISSENLAVSLQQAKLKLMRNNKYVSPYFWAPFVLIGY
jgi:CHAT domain-containing protein